MVIHMKDSGLMIWNKDMEFIHSLTGVNLRLFFKARGSFIKVIFMVKGLIFIQQDLYLKGNISMEKDMDMGQLIFMI